VAWDGGDLVISRVFPAARETVFAAWTRPEHFARWWGPHGSTTYVRTLDARPGGAIHFRHRFPDHPDVWIGGEYREVRAPELVSFTCWFSDEAGGRVEREGFPGEMTITVTFADDAEGTRITARHAGLVADQGEVQGWMEGLDRLATLLAASHHTSTGDVR
jgi:uncharacterized protein YndB with AHSA1/START domain